MVQPLGVTAGDLGSVYSPSIGTENASVVWAFDFRAPIDAFATTLQKIDEAGKKAKSQPEGQVTLFCRPFLIVPPTEESLRVTQAAYASMFAEGLAKARALALSAGVTLGPVTALGPAPGTSVGTASGPGTPIPAVPTAVASFQIEFGGAGPGGIRVWAAASTAWNRHVLVDLNVSGPPGTSPARAAQLVAPLGVTAAQAESGTVELPDGEKPARVTYTFQQRYPLTELETVLQRIMAFAKEVAPPYNVTVSLSGIAADPEELNARLPEVWPDLIAAGRREAEAFARAAGVEVGPLIEVSHEGFRWPSYPLTDFPGALLRFAIVRRQ
ncbi:MAG: hypothetical protein JNL98_40275 [Bryobacterales bacterium]|nr:hypothetical protein [Bryobacterales bacterium]